MLERSLGFAFNLNDYPGAIKLYIEDITQWREDTNFICEWQNNILRTSAASE